MSFTKLVHRFIADESAQGITEYGAILAFVALLVGLTFSLTTSALKNGIIGAYSAVVGQLNNLSGASASASSG